MVPTIDDGASRAGACLGEISPGDEYSKPWRCTSATVQRRGGAERARLFSTVFSGEFESADLGVRLGISPVREGDSFLARLLRDATENAS